VKKIFFIILFLLIVLLSFFFVNFNNDSRSLTEQEIKKLQTIFYNDVDYSQVMISTANLPPAMAAFVIGNRIIFREEYSTKDFSGNYLKMARLVHEIGHVWANQSTGLQTSLAAIMERVKFKDRVYSYDPLSGQKPLHEFRYEQQCQILSDYFIHRYLQNDVSAYEKTIYKTITGTQSKAP